jgi:hypothetical protein
MSEDEQSGGWETTPEELKARIRELEGALSDAVGAIRHADHPVASQWLPLLERKLRGTRTG